MNLVPSRLTRRKRTRHGFRVEHTVPRRTGGDTLKSMGPQAMAESKMGATCLAKQKAVSYPDATPLEAAEALLGHWDACSPNAASHIRQT